MGGCLDGLVAEVGVGFFELGFGEDFDPVGGEEEREISKGCELTLDEAVDYAQEHITG